MTAIRPAVTMAAAPERFSSEVKTCSRQENASNQESRAPFRFNRNGKGSSPAAAAKRRRLKGYARAWLSQRYDKFGAFAGLAGGDALIGNDDRAAGRNRFHNSRHRLSGNREAIQCLGRAIRHRHRLDLYRARDLAPPRDAFVFIATQGI